MNDPRIYRPEARYSPSGFSYTLLRRDMRLWPRRRLCAFYIYPKMEDAEKSVKVGASGFFVSIETVIPGIRFLYAVTNAHVVEGGGRVLAFNTVQGERKLMETEDGHWYPHPNGDDIAVLPIQGDPTFPEVAALDSTMMLSGRTWRRRTSG
jgi:hypothetical protein